MEKKIKLRIGGMTCVHCAMHVTQALEEIPGVHSVDLPSWQSPNANIVSDATISPDILTAAVQNAGYTASVEEQLPDTPENVQANSKAAITDFDLLVIGGGSGGFAAAISASDLGKRVGMINAGTIGGTCVNVGCVPSKTLIRAAEAWHNAGNHPFKGVITNQSKLIWATVQNEKDELVANMRQKKYVDVLATYPDINLIEGRASFQQDGSVRVNEKTYRANRYVIATGAQPRIPPIPGLLESQPLTSTTLMDLETLPKSLIVLGGRAVALELGQTMARFGVKVTILQRSKMLIPEHEPEVAQAVQDYLEQEGIVVQTGVQVEQVKRNGGFVTVSALVGGQIREYQADQILAALGRQPNTAGIGLENVGVEVDRFGAVIVNEYQQTTNPLIYATGDVTPNPDYVYVAAAGGAIAARNAIAGNQKPFDLSALPGIIFTDPQVATVGLTELEARNSGYQVSTQTLPLEYVPRAQAARNTKGLIKLVVDDATGRILGVHVLAAEAGEVIQTATLAVKFGIRLNDLVDTLFPYLTQVEGLKLAALSFSKDIAKLSCCAA